MTLILEDPANLSLFVRVPAMANGKQNDGRKSVQQVAAINPFTFLLLSVFVPFLKDQALHVCRL